jgi:DNA invertase Pin-like site-specific DNA recombinase
VIEFFETALFNGEIMPTAYSYVRFSNLEQRKGDSARRQVELSQKYAADHNLTLDDSLQLTDLGVSAFKGNNVDTGKLGLFISAIETGVVQSGSYLLVESLDRLSRSEILTALDLFNKILSKDISIVTLADNRVYTKESLTNIGELMFSLVIMSRAHEESLMKSKRIGAAWENKRDRARNSNHKITKACPGWMELVEGEFQLIQERVELVRRMYKMCLNGTGYTLILKQLNAEKIPTFNNMGKTSNGWHQSRVVRILKDPAVFGQFTPHQMLNGIRTPLDPIEDYFPAIIDKNDFYAVQAAISSRKGKGGEVGKQVNIIANIIKCGKCKKSAVRINKSGTRENNRHQRWVVMVCDSGRRGVTECGYHPWKLDELETAILAELKELDISTILDDKAKEESLAILAQNVQSMTAQITKISAQKNRLVEALADGEGGLEMLKDKLRTLSKEEETLVTARDIFSQEYERETHRLGAMVRSVDEIRRLAESLDKNEVRLKLQTEIRRLVDKIELHFERNSFVIYYHKPKTVIKYKLGRSQRFEDSGAEWGPFPPVE